MPEVLIVLVIALIVFGPKRLPELGRSLGKGINEFKDGMSGAHGDDEDKEDKEMRELHESKAAAEAETIESVEGEVVTEKRA